jgi:hypothetical protein
VLDPIETSTPESDSPLVIDFIFAEHQEGLCKVSDIYHTTNSAPVFVDLLKALKSLTGLDSFRDGFV